MGGRADFKQSLLAVNPRLGLCLGLTEGVPERARGSPGGRRAGRAVRSLISACQGAGRLPPQIAAATFVPLPPGTAAREAAPGTACADRSAASAAAAGWVAPYQNPWQEGGNELSPPLSQPPAVAVDGPGMRSEAAQNFLAMMMSFLQQHMFFTQEDHFPCHF